LRFGSGLRFDSGEGEGPFCSECLEKLERERIERERVERERVERERLERERVERERVERLRLESELDWIEEQQRERIERERPERERLERERLERERLELIKSPLNKKEQTQFEEIRDQFVEVGPPLESLTRDEIGDDPEGYFRVSMDYFIEHLELVITKESYSKIFYNLKRDLIYSAQTRRAEIIEEEQRTQKKAKDDIRIATLVTAVIVGILWWIGFYTDILV
jgi:hypothetical protein